MFILTSGLVLALALVEQDQDKRSSSCVFLSTAGLQLCYVTDFPPNLSEESPSRKKPFMGAHSVAASFSMTHAALHPPPNWHPSLDSSFIM